MFRMSAMPSSSSTSGLQDMLECPICCLRFERPIQLSCGHSFCGNCVDKLVTDARDAVNRNDNIFDEIEAAAMPVVQNLNRGMDQPNVNRMDGGLWMQFQRPHQPQQQIYGLGGFPQRYLFRNINYEPPFVHRRVHVVGGGAGGGDHIIKCPECRQPTRVPPEGLPVNYRLQEVISRVVENNTNAKSLDSQAAHATELDGGNHTRCLVCSDTMVKGVYLSCLTCDGDNVHQLCSMCCLRNHNGHEIKERRFLTMTDVVAARDEVSEATCRSYQAFDNMMNEFGTKTNEAQEYVRMRVRGVLEVFETIADQMNFELLSNHEELEYKVKIAQEIYSKLEQLPDDVKVIVDDFYNRIVNAIDFFDKSLLNDDIRGNANPLNEVMDSNSFEMTPGNSLNQHNTEASADSSSMFPYSCNQVDGCYFPRSSPRHGQKSQRVVMTQSWQAHRNRMGTERARVTQRNMKERQNSILWDFECERERREVFFLLWLIRDQHRHEFVDGDDGRVLNGKRYRALSPASTSSCIVQLTGSERMEENQGNKSIEFISEIPSAVNNLELRAEQLVITPDLHRERDETDVTLDFEDCGQSQMVAQTNVKNKHRRGKKFCANEGVIVNKSAENGESLPVPKSISICTRKRKKCATINPGPSWFSEQSANDNTVEDATQQELFCDPNGTGSNENIEN